MKNMGKKLVLGAVFSLLAASAAHAAPMCLGTDGTFKVCADTTKTPLDTANPLYQECIYLGSASCTNVKVPGLKPFGEGNTISYYCGIDGEPDVDCNEG